MCNAYFAKLFIKISRRDFSFRDNIYAEYRLEPGSFWKEGSKNSVLKINENISQYENYDVIKYFMNRL